MPPSLAELTELQERLRYDTPFWTGGVLRRPGGGYDMPGPKDWQGCMKVVNKQRRLVPLVARPWQLDLDERMEAQRRAGKPMRGIVLKARKTGISTWIAAKFLQRLTQIEYQHAIICAQDTKTAGVVFEMALTAHRNLPAAEDLGVAVRPAIVNQSFQVNGRKFMAFGANNKRDRDRGAVGESILEIDTAISGEAGRGFTPSMLHCSEVGRWEGAQATRKMIGLLNALPQEPETICILESTANGLNHFHRRWQQAVSGGEDPDTGESYFAMFVAWWIDPDCAASFENAGARERFIESIGDTRRYGEVAEDERELEALYTLTPEQLLWRRRMIREQHEGNIDLFRQEWPASAEEAFIGSGRTVFSPVAIRKALAQAEGSEKPVRGSLAPADVEEKRGRSGTVEVPRAAVWVPQAGKLVLEVWEHPRKREAPVASGLPQVPPAPTAQSSPELIALAASLAVEEQYEAEPRDGAYVVAVDVAEDDATTFGEGLDSHAIQVFDHHTRQQVAVHESRCELHELARLALLVALYYNQAWLAIEINGPGLAVLDPIAKDYRYPRLYRRRRLDSTKQRTEDRAGWRTEPASKPVMESALAAQLAADEPGLRDVYTAKQLLTYVVNEKGKHGAIPGEHDDRLIAAMIAQRVMDEIRPPLLPRSRRAFKPKDPLTAY